MEDKLASMTQKMLDLQIKYLDLQVHSAGEITRLHQKVNDLTETTVQKGVYLFMNIFPTEFLKNQIWKIHFILLVPVSIIEKIAFLKKVLLANLYCLVGLASPNTNENSRTIL